MVVSEFGPRPSRSDNPVPFSVGIRGGFRMLTCPAIQILNHARVPEMPKAGDPSFKQNHHSRSIAAAISFSIWGNGFSGLSGFSTGATSLVPEFQFTGP